MVLACIGDRHGPGPEHLRAVYDHDQPNVDHGLGVLLPHLASAITLDYRLTPEHPYPAAVDGVRAAYEELLAQGKHPGQIVLAGDSAGGGLAVATILASREAGLPMPSRAFLMSPHADLTMSGETLTKRQSLDPIMTPESLRVPVFGENGCRAMPAGIVTQPPLTDDHAHRRNHLSKAT